MTEQQFKKNHKYSQNPHFLRPKHKTSLLTQNLTTSDIEKSLKVIIYSTCRMLKIHKKNMLCTKKQKACLINFSKRKLFF